MEPVNQGKIGPGLYKLHRGGYLAETPAGNIQFGAPPETIKDTMHLQSGVPDIFVLADEMFSWIKGISIGEIEFPLYYNYFLRNKKTLIICRKNQLVRIKKVLQESIFGPKNFDISRDYDPSVSKETVPDIKSEMNFFRKNNRLSNMVSFGIFENNKFSYKGVEIKIDNSGDFILSWKKSRALSIPGKVDYKPTYFIGERLAEPYLPPLFGVTCLGPSHGFDPAENTSGFIIWLNHQGIMVDPPVNSTEWLEDSNVSPKFIDSIILTHCHADHDAGTFQKILEEGKVSVYTTETVMMSFLRKYSALSNVKKDYLMKLFNFHPVKIGSPVYINGGKFNMFYTLHSIPSIGFKMEFQDQSFVYSSDHNNDPEIHRELKDKGVINDSRYRELSNFPWDSKVIYHESGIPPLHTPIKYLNSLPQEIQKRTVVYHIAKKDFPEKTDLRLAHFGMEHTLYFKTRPPLFEEASKILSVFNRLDFMNDMPAYKAQELLDIVEVKKFRQGEKLIRKGSAGDEFYIIYAGNISVDSGGLSRSKIYGPYDYFGEVALITEQKRAADVYAETDVILFTIEKDKFLNFISGTEFEKILRKVAEIRSSETWNLLSMNNFFRYCTSTQITWLESMFVPCEIKTPGRLINEGNKIDRVYIIRHGEVEVTEKKKYITTLKKGDFVGSLDRLYKKLPSKYTFSITKPISLYSMEHKDIRVFLDKNPGLVMKFSYNLTELKE
jgi:CRP-like cAMP-binding protein/phosphoribosyl 1,2-cyclic phosphodiesterase